ELPYAASAWTVMSAKLDAKDTPRSNTRWYVAASILAVALTASFIALNDSTEEQKPSTQPSEVAQNKTPETDNNKGNNSSTSPTKDVNYNEATPSNIETPTNGGQPIVVNEPTKPINNPAVSGEGNPLAVPPTNGPNEPNPGANNTTPVIAPFILPVVNNVCQGTSIKITNANEYPMSIVYPNGSIWSARGESETTLTTAISGTYIIGYMKDGQLQEEGSFNVDIAPTSDFDFVNLHDILLDGLPTTEVSTSSPGIKHEWKYGNQTSSGSQAAAHFFKKGNYDIELTVTGSNGCKSSITKVVNIKDNYNLLAVNAFDPRSLDARNNTFIPRALVERNDVNFSMIIVNHTDGHIMYETSDASQGWDGIDRATGEQLGYQKTFIWKVSIENPELGESSVYGSSAIILPRQN
ncbi:MAG: hypothetical protein HRT57_09245, partial [Crocinitomicaceae bacterium]|nr:hypothetical protein [Crocinitomicaceae bacterium]